MSFKWYVIHVYSGHEHKVKAALEERFQTSNNPDKFGEILIPTESTVELVDGKKKEAYRKFYPGYILVKMFLDNETWHIVSSTAKVTGFLGGKNKPAPLSDKEAQDIIERMQERQSKPQSKYYFEYGDTVKVIDGPFANFNGVVEEVSPDKEKIKVLVSIFGRSTPVELNFIQVTRI